jgi:DNA primase
MSNVFDHIKEFIPILEVAKKFPDFYKSLQKSGHDYGTACPTGHSSQSGRSFKVVSDGHSKDFYYCHSCGISGNAFSLAQLLLEKETRETIEWFVKTFQVRPKLSSF